MHPVNKGFNQHAMEHLNMDNVNFNSFSIAGNMRVMFVLFDDRADVLIVAHLGWTWNGHSCPRTMVDIDFVA